MAVLLLIPTFGFAQTTTNQIVKKDLSVVEQWWNGKYATGNWFGARDVLEDHGVRLSGEWKANLLWNVDGGLKQRFGYDDEWKIRLNIDFAKLTRADVLKGLTFYTDLRYRGGAGVNQWVGSNNFQPSTFQGGRLWRFLNAYLTYTTPELFGIKDFLTLSGGWQDPTDLFLNQPQSKLFLNNSITSSKGINADGIPWGSTYSAWGGYTKIKPVDWYYAQAGLYLAIPFATDTNDHGLDFAGYGPNPNLNGLYFLAETGFTPNIGPSKLPGKYSAGYIYWGVENKSFYGVPYDQKELVYFQVDQQLYRPSTPRPAVSGKISSDGKSSKEVVTAANAKLTDKGLYFFSVFNVAPSYNCAFPFYFHTGLVYKGLIPTRDHDQIGVAFAYGDYSYNLQQSQISAGKAVQTYEAVLEFDYRVQINQWAYCQPSLQYIIRPNGTGVTQNATVIGFQLGVNF
ncbi:MAG: carbohydrate porin [Chthoniobacterales bacterium]